MDTLTFAPEITVLDTAEALPPEVLDNTGPSPAAQFAAEKIVAFTCPQRTAEGRPSEEQGCPAVDTCGTAADCLNI